MYNVEKEKRDKIMFAKKYWNKYIQLQTKHCCVYVLYSTLLLLSPLRYNWVGGCWDRTHATVATSALAARHSNFSAIDLIRSYGMRQCWGSVTFWCGSGSPDPYLWLMIRIRIWIQLWIRIQLRIRLLFSLILRMRKNIIFILFSYNLPSCTSSSV